MASQSESNIPPAPKRSLFKKSTWVEPAEDDEALQLFSRSKEIFPDIIAENERRRKGLENSGSNVNVNRTDCSASNEKRKRVSKESDDLQEHSSEDEITARLLQGRRTSTTLSPQPPSANLSSTPLKQKRSPSSKSRSRQGSIDKKASSKSKAQQAAVIALSDSEDEGVTPGVTNAKPSQIDLGFDSDVEEEVLKPSKVVISPVKEVFEVEEFPEYVAKAREGAGRRMFGRLDPGQSNARSDSISSNESTTKLETTSKAHPVSTLPTVLDPIVQLLVTSRIAGTKPMIMKRKISQRLKDVKFAWCDKQVLDGQPVPEEVKRMIFLTWRGNKVFDVTTCKAMGLDVDALGRLRIDGEGFDEEGRIHLEAWTEEIFDEYKKRKAAERKRLDLDPMEEEEEKEPEIEETGAGEEVQKLRIILKSKDRTEFKIQVSPTTPISKMIAAFRHKNKLEGDVNISLYLDGDKLDPKSLVGDADLEELTNIDVHVG